MPGITSLSITHSTYPIHEPLPSIQESQLEQSDPFYELEGIILDIIDKEFDKFLLPKGYTIIVEPVMYYILTSQDDYEVQKKLFYRAIETFARHEKPNFVESLLEFSKELNINWFTDIPLIFHELKGYYLCDRESRTPLFYNCIDHNRFFLPNVIQYAMSINDSSGLIEILQQSI